MYVAYLSKTRAALLRLSQKTPRGAGTGSRPRMNTHIMHTTQSICCLVVHASSLRNASKSIVCLCMCLFLLQAAAYLLWALFSLPGTRARIYSLPLWAGVLHTSFK